MSIDILDNSERIKLNLVRNLILSADKDTIIKDLDKVLHVLLDLNLIPADTNTGVRNGESLLFFCGLDLDLHDTFLEKGKMQIEASSAEFDVVRLVIFVLVKHERSNDSIFVDNETVWLNVVRSHKVIGLRTIPDIFVTLVLRVVS